MRFLLASLVLAIAVAGLALPGTVTAALAQGNPCPNGVCPPN